MSVAERAQELVTVIIEVRAQRAPVRFGHLELERTMCVAVTRVLAMIKIWERVYMFTMMDMR